MPLTLTPAEQARNALKALRAIEPEDAMVLVAALTTALNENITFLSRAERESMVDSLDEAYAVIEEAIRDKRTDAEKAEEVRDEMRAQSRDEHAQPSARGQL